MNLQALSPVPVLSNNEQFSGDWEWAGISVPEESQQLERPKGAEGFPCTEMTTKMSSFVQDPNQHRVTHVLTIQNTGEQTSSETRA